MQNAKRILVTKARRYIFCTVFTFIISLLVGSSALAEHLVPITVQKGTNLIQLTRRFCTSEYHWKEIARINGLQPPYTIFANDVLHIPLELLRAEVLSAKVASVSGGVFLVDRMNRLVKVAKGDAIFPGQTMVTEDGGYAYLIFPDHKYTRISGDSKFTVTYMVRLVDESFKAEFFLEKGRVTHTVKEQLEINETFTTRTPVSVTGVRGTTYRLKAPDSDENTVETLKGLVSVSGGKFHAEVKEGQCVKVVTGGGEITVDSLPEAPAPLQLAEIYGELPIVIPAPADPAIKTFRLLVSRDKAGNDLVLERVAASGEDFSLLSLADGQYYAHLTAIDDRNYESAPSSPALFAVRTTFLPPTLLVSREGKILFNDTVKVGWLRNEQAKAYHFQLAADENFADILEERDITANEFAFTNLEPGSYRFRVQAVAEDGFRSRYSAVDRWRIQAEADVSTDVGSSDDGLHFQWADMGKGFTYDIEISRNNSFTDIFLSESDLDTTEFASRKYIEPGTYYFHMRGVAEDGMATPWTPTQVFDVKQPGFGLMDAAILGVFLSFFLL
ncbi:MAG: hypothetical protein CSB23_04330 [Deltaproteobacteria bacterium]|nr:MAG: hypothetical protein CSB23_04330 [Deltaproteobacteria bacterium]